MPKSDPQRHSQEYNNFILGYACRKWIAAYFIHSHSNVPSWDVNPIMNCFIFPLTQCQQDLPMMSPASITAASTRKNDYPENRYSIGLDASDESQLIKNSSKSKSKDGRKSQDSLEKTDKTRLSRKDSKKEKERAKERGKENQVRDDAPSVVQQQPKTSQSPRMDLDVAVPQADRNGKGPRREKSDKAKSPKPQRNRNSGRTSPKREGKQKDRNVDMEGLIPPSKGAAERSVGVGGITFALVGTGVTEQDGLLSSTSQGDNIGFDRTSEMSGVPASPTPSSPPPSSPPPSSPPPSSPPPSATSQRSDQVGTLFITGNDQQIS